MSLTVRQAGPADETAWEAFAQERATAFHRLAWGRATEATHGHEAVNLMAERGGEVVGILPLTDKRSAIFGRALISVAFTVGGGAAALDDEARDALLARAGEEGRARGSDYVELRGGAVPEGWVAKEGTYAEFGCPLTDDQDAQLKAIPRKKRADVRKAIKAAAEGSIEARVTNDLDGFWKHYAIAQRDHGTPVLPKALLARLMQGLGDSVEIAEVFAGGERMAGVMSVYHRGTVHLYHAYIGPEARRHHAGDYLYYWMMGHARSKGCGWFDLGRSKTGTGSYAYKTYWGMEPRPMSYAYLMLGAEEMPDINPNNPKFKLMTQVWSKLPMPVANLMGPRLYGHLG